MNDKPKVVSLVPPKEDLVKSVLAAAVEQDLQEVMVLGWSKTQDRNFYIGVSTHDKGDIALLLRYCSILVDQWMQERD